MTGTPRPAVAGGHAWIQNEESLGQDEADPELHGPLRRRIRQALCHEVGQQARLGILNNLPIMERPDWESTRLSCSAVGSPVGTSN
jgi:hypothetical protein